MGKKRSQAAKKAWVTRRAKSKKGKKAKRQDIIPEVITFDDSLQAPLIMCSDWDSTYPEYEPVDELYGKPFTGMLSYPNELEELIDRSKYFGEHSQVEQRCFVVDCMIAAIDEKQVKLRVGSSKLSRPKGQKIDKDASIGFVVEELLDGHTTTSFFGLMHLTHKLFTTPLGATVSSFCGSAGVWDIYFDWFENNGLWTTQELWEIECAVEGYDPRWDYSFPGNRSTEYTARCRAVLLSMMDHHGLVGAPEAYVGDQ